MTSTTLPDNLYEVPKRKLKLYLAGPMSGYEEHNFPAFEFAAEILRDYGHRVVSPAEIDVAEGFDSSGRQVTPGSDEYESFLRRDLEIIADPTIEAIAVLGGWEESNGATRELARAQELGKPIYNYFTGKKITHTIVPLERKDPQPNQDFDVGLKIGGGETRIVDPNTGGMKGQKLERFDLIPTQALQEIARVYGMGAAKYDDDNWRKGYRWRLSYGAMLRHVNAWALGESYDDESDLHHLAHAAWHCLALMTFEFDRLGTDDLPERDASR